MSPINVHADVSSYARDQVFVWSFIYIYTMCVRAAKAQASLRMCADPLEPLLLAKTVSTEIYRNGPIIFPALNYNRASSMLANWFSLFSTSGGSKIWRVYLIADERLIIL